MGTIQRNAFEIARTQSGVLRTAEVTSWTVGALERALLAMFPAADALDWDRTGLLVGNRDERVTGIVLALDATSTAIKQAHECGANVVLTHHPAFIDPPVFFGPLSDTTIGSSAAVWQAASQGIALINFHTALDVSVQAQHMLPGMLGLIQRSVLEPIDVQGSKGYGQICEVEDGLTLEQMAARCVSVFNRIPRVWGMPATKLQRIVTATGSGGSLLSSALEQRIDCVICGELHYHDALAASEAGLCLIELGHDVSELPLCAVLAVALEQIGVSNDMVTVIDQSGNWWTPEATRR